MPKVTWWNPTGELGPSNNALMAEKRREAITAQNELEAQRPRVDRDPCFNCGVRGDFGCRHRGDW